MKSKQTNKLWGAAFSQKPSEAVIAFTAGRDVASVPPADEKLLPYDLWVNKAHCIMLAKTGIIPKSDAGKILKGLVELEKLAEGGKFTLDPAKEDVHTNIESWLTGKLGIDVAGKLHTARSRNDQTNTDTRLFLRDQVLQFVENTSCLIQELLILAKEHDSTVMPGFTHHQHAMVTTWGHVLAAFATMLLRDTVRFTHWYSLHNYSPLGNSVSYGTTFPIDRALTAKLLGFDGPEVNSLDEITNRWEAEADLGFAVSIFMNHLSLIAETLIIFATPEFGMVMLADQYSTGSSIMPQKKNPDPLEAIKGKTAYTAGILSGLLSMGKSNFIGFNRDSQWTKYLIMDLVEEGLPAPVVMKGVIETLTVNKTAMASWCDKGFIGATSLMEYIIQEYSIPMRNAKVLVEKAVKASGSNQIVTFSALQQVLAGEGLSLPISEAQVANWQDPATIISLTKSFGGPGKQSMKTTLKKLYKTLQKQKSWLVQKQKEKASAKALLTEYI